MWFSDYMGLSLCKESAYNKDRMEQTSETERFENGAIPRELEILTPEIVALRALIDHLGEAA